MVNIRKLEVWEEVTFNVSLWILFNKLFCTYDFGLILLSLTFMVLSNISFPFCMSLYFILFIYFEMKLSFLPPKEFRSFLASDLLISSHQFFNFHL